MINPHLLEIVHVRGRSSDGRKAYVAAFRTTRGETFSRRRPLVFRNAHDARRHAEAVRHRWQRAYDDRIAWLSKNQPKMRKPGPVMRIWTAIQLWRLRRAATFLAQTIRRVEGVPAAERFMTGFDELARKVSPGGAPRP